MALSGFIGLLERRRFISLTLENVALISANQTWSIETGLLGWGGRIRAGSAAREDEPIPRLVPRAAPATAGVSAGCLCVPKTSSVFELVRENWIVVPHVILNRFADPDKVRCNGVTRL